MSLMEDIEKYKKEKEVKQIKKIDILERYRKEIEEMIEIEIPIKTQIELIIKHTEIEKLFYAEYYNIIKKNFGYKKEEETKKSKEETIKIIPALNKVNQKRRPSDILSEDFDLLTNHLKSIQNL